MRREQQGYIFLEVLVVGVVLLAMTASMHLYHHTLLLEAKDGVQITGTYLAREEFSWLECQAEKSGLPDGEQGWLGDEAALCQNNGHYQVKAEVSAIAEKTWQVVVHVDWQQSNQAGSFALSRVICQHRKRAAL